MSKITAINKILEIRKEVNEVKDWVENPIFSANKVLEFLDDIQKELEEE